MSPMTSRALTLAVSGLALWFCAWSAPAAQAPSLLLRHPTLSRSEIVFSFAGDLWSVPRVGGQAKRVTTGSGTKTDPIFSPDGRWIAFTGDYDGNQDVYVTPSSGGELRRLTYHPSPDQALGWTPDGRRVLFRSSRDAYANIVPKFQRLFTVGLQGDPVAEVPLPMGHEAAFSPDGSQLAYVPLERKNDHFRRYRGGRTTPIWIARMSDGHIEEIPRDNSTDFNPMWVGRTVYFLSDRDGPATLYSYDTETKRAARLFDNRGLDLTAASAGPDAIVYEQFGSLHLYHPHSGATEGVVVQIDGDFPQIQPRMAPAGNALREARLSPAGDRVAFVARGDLLVFDVRTGRGGNLTRSPGTMERDPAWAPDGERVAYFSDESGEYALHVRPANGDGAAEKIGLGEPPSFYYAPRWSPDGTKVAYIDKRQNVWYVDVRDKKPVKVDTDVFFDYFRTFIPVTNLAPVWSPDARWLAYAKHLRNGFGAIFLYSSETGQSTQVTDASCDAMHPAFDPDGTSLYFTAKTSSTPAGKGRAHVVRLRKDGAAPRAGESGDAGREPDLPEKPRTVVDLEGISQRVRPLPVPLGNYAGVVAYARRGLFLLDAGNSSPFDPPSLTVHRLDLQAGKTDPYLTHLSSADISADGQTMLYQKEGRWATSPTASPPRAGEGLLPIEALTVWVEPRASWRQMFQEVLRLERDFFYDPNLHGLDLKAMEARYRPYLEGLVTRADLNVLFQQMLGELSVSHVKVSGGDLPEQPQQPRVGLLGADYAIEGGHYRFARVYTGDRLDPGVNAPLVPPGGQVAAGEYLLTVDGRPLTAGSDNVYRAFEGKAGKPTVIRVGADPGGAGARDLIVTPVPSELGLRQWAWTEENRRRVSDATQGRVGYVYVPHTLGFEGVNYALSAQKDKEAVIFDERFALGGDLPVAFMERLSFPLISLLSGRESHGPPDPQRIMVPKVLLINEYAGSGSDALAWYFRRLGLGPIVGKRTRGELTGAFGTPDLMDGGVLEIPSVVIWGTKGELVENHGVAPDIEVTLDPEQFRRGYDPQLEAAIKATLDELQKSPANLPRRPAYPNY